MRLFFIFLVFISAQLSAQKVGTANGSGIALTKNGYIATNHHVIEDATKIEVDIFTTGVKKTYKAELVKSDKENDVAVIKISDPTFKGFAPIPYAFKMSNVNVAEKVFAMGYPKINLQGEEVKVTEGIISSKTGFQNDNKTYQISAAIQPGNSGGPLFDNSGNLIGLTNAGIPSGENVGYAIKISYLSNFIDLIPNFPALTEKTTISALPLTGKVKALSRFVVLIRVEVPICDFDLPSNGFLKINQSLSLNDLNQILKTKGELIGETGTARNYRFSFCDDNVMSTINVTIADGVVAGAVKNFRNSTCFGFQVVKEFVDIKIGSSYSEVKELFKQDGDLKIITWDHINMLEQSRMYEWKSCDGKVCYRVNFFKGKVVGSSKTACY